MVRGEYFQKKIPPLSTASVWFPPHPGFDPWSSKTPSQRVSINITKFVHLFDRGGYLITPHLVEFWQGQSDRTHDRIVFRKKLEDEQIDPNLTKEGEDGWLIERLAP